MEFESCRSSVASGLLLGAVLAAPNVAVADEGGMSFWVPGFFGSLAATPQVPGFSLATIYYHTSVSAGRNVSLPIGGQIVAGVDADVNLGFVIPSYVFGTPFLGGQAAVSLLVPFGRNRTSAEATLTGPLGRTISGSRTDTVTGFADLVPQASLRWNHGVHNFMTYITAGLPVGDYETRRLANLGLGHWSVDGGGGYTYFDPHAGVEFSAVAGLTYNFENPHTDYQSGIDFHLDWGTAKFLTKQWLIGAVGYAYQQLTGDSGSGARLGPFKSRVFGIGPQIGYIFPISEHYQGYLNLKGYKEFEAENRPEGWNVWLTFAVSPAAPTPPLRPMAMK